MKNSFHLAPALCFVAIAALSPVSGQAEERPDSRRADLALLLDRLIPSSPPPTGRINAVDRTWEDWVRRTGELPPDFRTMPSQAGLPDPLILQTDGRATPVTSLVEWEQQRRWIRSQIEHWVFGKMPPRPDNLRVASSEERQEDGMTVRNVLLEFGPGHRAKLHLQLYIPSGPGPFPVFLTNHSREQSPWIRTAVGRGYLACYYQATDPTYGKSDDSDGYIDVYPKYDFSCLARWAWAASRAVDYLYTRSEVEKDHIGIAGHSRNGKQALLATAFDERIGAVIASSGLQGEVFPHRFTSDPLSVESIQLITGAQPHWYHPRLRFFTGREDKLPVDQNMLMALVAPRGLMFYSGYSEISSNAFISEQAYQDVRRVYRFLGREENIWLHLRPGGHATEVADVENFMDFFDAVFARRTMPKVETWIHGYDFEDWKKTTGEKVDPLQFPVRKPGDFAAAVTTTEDWAKKKPEIRRRLEWALGTPPRVLTPPDMGSAASLVHQLRENTPPVRNPLDLALGRPQADKVWQDRLAANGMGVSSLSYGTGLKADVFYPAGPDGKRKAGKLPVVIWLHAYSYDQGWSIKEPWNPKARDYQLDQRPSLDSLVRRGFVVVAFDQLGFGSRSHDARTFYARYPQWSLMGKMVTDTRTVVDAVMALEDVDTSRIFLLGYALGAKVGLLTAALDDRIKGVAAVSGLFPLRLDSPEKGTEGVRHYSHLHGLIPKLGFFIGQEARAPFDYDEVLALAAPKKVLILAPELDRYAPVEDVRAEVAAARKIYDVFGKSSELELRTPRDFNRFPRQLQEEMFTYLEKAAQ